LVELRTDKFTPNPLLRKATLVNSSGSVYALNGTPLKITAPPGDYWIVVHQRNHLSVMSSNAVTLTKIPPPTIPTVIINSASQIQPILIEDENMHGLSIKR